MSADLVALKRFDFRILGPLEAYRDGAPIPLGGPRQRAALAVLLLNANRVVSRERLASDLEYEQADADHALRIQVSRLRKSLGEGSGADSRLVTRAPGYLLRVEDGELDLDRFEAFVAAGREAIDRGDWRQGVSALRDADALWRGRPLADLAESPAGVAADHLEELRLAAVEQRLEAELSLGHHAALVAELEALVGRHPLREGLRFQLMLALYRCGRQAEALEVYRAGRAILDDELGLEPGTRLKELEQAILRHDRELDPGQRTPAVRGAAIVQTSKRRRPRLWPGVGVAAFLAAVGATGIVVFAGSRSSAPPERGNGMVLISATGEPTGATTLDAAPTRVAVGLRSLWVSQLDAGTVSRIDLATRTVRQTIRVGRGPAGIAVASGDVWVANSVDGTVSRIDPRTNTVVKTIPVGSQPSAAVAVNGSVWIVDRGDDNILKLDGVTGRIRRIVDTGSGPIDAAAAGHTLWIANEGDGTVMRLDAGTGQVVDTIHVGDAPSAITASKTSVWVADELDSTVSRIDPRTDAVAPTIAVGSHPAGIALVDGAVLVSDLETGRLLRIDVEHGSLARLRQVGERAGPIADVGGRAWVGVVAGGADHHGGTLRVVGGGSPISLDPALEDELTPLQLLGLTNDGLITLDRAGGAPGAQLVPDLALSLPRPTDSGRTYTFRLRHGIRYSTGGVVTAKDVRSSFERLFELRSAGRSFYDKIRGAHACLRSAACDLSRGIVVDGQDTVAFHLTSPDPDFLAKLTEPYADVLPSSAPRRAGRSPLPATGPFMVVDFEPGRVLKLVRNPRFREWSAAAQPAAYPDSITWRFGLTPTAAVKLVERGKADLMQFVGGLSTREWAVLRTRFPSRLRTNPAMGTNFYFLNTRSRPFDKASVRRAFNFALDRRRMVALAGGPNIARPTCQILPPQMPGYDRYCPYTRKARVGSETPDLQRARRLVDASGTKGMRVKVWDTPGPGGRDPGGHYLVTVLERLGYRASLHLLPDAAFLRYTDESRHHAQVVSGGWGADYPSPSSMIGKLACAGFIPNSSRTFDDSEFCDPRIDRQITHAESLGPTSHREATLAWRRLDRELTDRAVWLPTTTMELTDIISPRVGNYEYNPFWGAVVDQLWVR